MQRAARVAWAAAVPALLAAVQPLSATGTKDISAGERAYQKCYSCHSIEGRDPRLQGPALNGILGRKVAAEPGFAYSGAMQAYAERQDRWTREALDAFIADPLAVVPGNDMGFFGISDIEERQALIAYLADT